MLLSILKHQISEYYEELLHPPYIIIQSLSDNNEAVCPPLGNGNAPSGSRFVQSDVSISKA